MRATLLSERGRVESDVIPTLAESEWIFLGEPFPR